MISGVQATQQMILISAQGDFSLLYTGPQEQEPDSCPKQPLWSHFTCYFPCIFYDIFYFLQAGFFFSKAFLFPSSSPVAKLKAAAAAIHIVSQRKDQAGFIK